jgi:DNA invertase Pin-like site-specific DNA recombinase
MMKKAYSYARFSTSEQLDGRSLKRQEEAAKSYCQRHGLLLDEQSFTDLGVSGYSGANAKGGQLGVFLELIREGRIPKGSTLIVENIDRISRLPPHEANKIIMAIVKAGVNIATTSPEQTYTLANIKQVGTWIPLQVAQCLAAAESEKKSDRLKDAWGAKRAELGNGHKMTKKGPAWLKLTADGKDWVVIERKAAMVRRVFEMCIAGMGAKAIAVVLYKEFPEGLTGRGWEPAQICTVVRNRAAIGEYQPHVGTCAKKGGVKATRKPAGDPIKGYFPAIISEADFYRANDAMTKRHKSGGRTTGVANLFNGILKNAVDGWPMVILYGGEKKALVSAGAARGRSDCTFRTVNYARFERAVLDQLLELTVADVLGKPARDDDPAAVWSGKLVIVNRNLAAMQKQAAVAEDATVFVPILEDLSRQRKENIAGLEKAKAESASREGDLLGETQSLVKLMDDAEGDEKLTLRRKVRAALRRLIESAWIVIVPRGRLRLVALQLRFAGGKKCRNYLFACRPGTKKTPGRWDAWSLAEKVEAGDLDLRDQIHAAELEKILANLDPTQLA